MHYHEGMEAGDNTLNALCARVVMRGIAQRKGWNQEGFLEDWVCFMTTPGSHNGEVDLLAVQKQRAAARGGGGRARLLRSSQRSHPLSWPSLRYSLQCI